MEIILKINTFMFLILENRKKYKILALLCVIYCAANSNASINFGV